MPCCFEAYPHRRRITRRIDGTNWLICPRIEPLHCFLWSCPHWIRPRIAIRGRINSSPVWIGLYSCYPHAHRGIPLETHAVVWRLSHQVQSGSYHTNISCTIWYPCRILTMFLKFVSKNVHLGESAHWCDPLCWAFLWKSLDIHSSCFDKNNPDTLWKIPSLLRCCKFYRLASFCFKSKSECREQNVAAVSCWHLQKEVLFAFGNFPENLSLIKACSCRDSLRHLSQKTFVKRTIGLMTMGTYTGNVTRLMVGVVCSATGYTQEKLHSSADMLSLTICPFWVSIEFLCSTGTQPGLVLWSRSRPVCCLLYLSGKWPCTWYAE